MFGVFLFLVYYMQTDLGYSAITSGVALLPMVTLTAVTTIVGNVALMPRVGPKPLVTAGFLINAAGMAWLTRIGADSGYASALLGPILVVGIGMGLIYGAAFATGTSGVEPRDAGIASGSVSTGQQLGGAIGTALLNTIAASATADYLASHVNGQPAPLQVHLAAIHGYTTVFWWCTGIYAAGALICGTLLRRGALPLHEGAPAAEPSRQAEATQSGELSLQAEEVGS
jgi:MFS family permease